MPLVSPADYTVQALKSGAIRFACEQPDNGKTTRGICLSGAPTCWVPPARHEYMLKYLLGTDSGIQGDELGRRTRLKPEEVERGRPRRLKASSICW